MENAINSLGAGFLETRGNEELKHRLTTGALDKQDYYRQLLRMVYRLLMLLVAEEKKDENGQNLLHTPGTSDSVRQRYAKFYSVGRLRDLAGLRRGTSHTDLFESLKVLFEKLREGYEPLGIPGLGSFLFSTTATPDLDNAHLSNVAILDCFRQLSYTDDESKSRRVVDFGNLGSEELGSVYESLLELHPKINSDKGPFILDSAAGSERKTTGSYYTPTSLINCLLDSALDPVVNDAINVSDSAEAERRLLNLKVCDPACGSGHFLIAAAERLALHLARIRTGDDQPATMVVQHAKRDIIGRCIYGVDLNPMAVELCKVSLWMEALDPGRPLSFLDHHIQCGNSLLGTTPALLKQGIPDAAFNPIEGDVKAICTDLKKRNKRERADRESGQGYLFESYIKLGNFPSEFTRLSGDSDDSVAAVDAKAKRYAELVNGADYLNARLLADTWCAAFVWKKDVSDLGKLCPTERDFRNVEDNPHSILPHVKTEVRRLAEYYRFFHWHLVFPDVFRMQKPNQEPENTRIGLDGGFHVLLGNPPWDRLKLDTTEWFSSRAPEIANEGDSDARKLLIAQLADKDPELFREYSLAVQEFEAGCHLLRHADVLTRGTKGEADLSTAFAELDSILVSLFGRVGIVVSGTTLTGKSSVPLLNHWTRENQLASAWEFINAKRLFDIHSSQRFALLTLSAPQLSPQSAVAFDLLDPVDIPTMKDAIVYTDEEIRLLSPNTLQFPKIGDKRTKELLVRIARAGTPLQTENSDPFGFITAFIFEEAKSRRFFSNEPSTSTVSVLEGKSFHQFDHRFANYANCTPAQIIAKNPIETSVAEHMNPLRGVAVGPRLYADSTETAARYRAKFSRHFAFAAREVTNSTNERTTICTVLPQVAVLHSAWIFDFAKLDCSSACWLFANFNSFAFDFTARQKVTTSHLSKYVWVQLPILDPSFRATEVISNVVRCVLELTYTAWDLKAFALDCGYNGPPFRWDEERRFLLRCELDAAYFHLYLGSPEEWGNDSPQLREMFPTPRHAVEYIMETFPIVKRKDIKRTTVLDDTGQITQPGTYITKDTILSIYDAMTESIRTGIPYQTRLDPPPGPPTDSEGNFIPMEDWRGQPIHIHPPKGR